ncbi:MAG: Gfo/Idh/MocA family oxidoreductase [Micropepsaceae bacterium]
MSAYADVTGALRVSVIGLGQRMAAVLVALKRAGGNPKIEGYFDPSPAGLERLATEGIGPGQQFDRVEQAVNTGSADLIMIASPNHMHASHMDLALKGSVPVFVEKPIVRTEQESLEIARRISNGSIPPLYVGLVMRSAPIVQEVLSIVREGTLGDIISIDATEHLPPEHGSYLARNWRRRKEWGGSYLLDKVCHDFDILSDIAGARPRHVASFGGRRIFTPDRAADQDSASTAALGLWPGGWAADDDAFNITSDVTDHQTALVQFANGVQLSFHANSAAALRERRWYIAGTKGTLMADLVRNSLMWRRLFDSAPPMRKKFPVSGDDHNGADIAMATDLLKALSGTSPFPAQAWLAIEAGLTVMAIDRAMDECRIVDLTEMWATLDRVGQNFRHH